MLQQITFGPDVLTKSLTQRNEMSQKEYEAILSVYVLIDHAMT